jgi:hypothetical protein
MSLSTYNDLLSAITNWTHRSDLASYSPDFVSLGESRINSELRVRAMETTVASTISAGVIAVPTGYIEMKEIYISSTTPYMSLQRKTVNWIYDQYPVRASQGKPQFFAREGSNFIFGPFPDSNYTLTLLYYARPTALSSATNNLFIQYPGLYLFAALAETAPFLKDDKRVPLWEAKFQALKQRAQDEDDDEDHSGSVMQVNSIGLEIK